MPRTYAAASSALSSGSSLKHSKWRPPSGERCRLIVGPRTTSTPLRRASDAAAAPYRYARSTSHDAARAEPDGRLSDGSRSSQRGPRTPAGPSDRVIARSPISGTGTVVQKSAPCTRAAFCSRVRRSSSGTRCSTDSGCVEVAVSVIGGVSVLGRRVRGGCRGPALAGRAAASVASDDAGGRLGVEEGAPRDAALLLLVGVGHGGGHEQALGVGV